MAITIGRNHYDPPETSHLSPHGAFRIQRMRRELAYAELRKKWPHMPQYLLTRTIHRFHLDNPYSEYLAWEVMLSAALNETSVRQRCA